MSYLFVCRGVGRILYREYLFVGGREYLCVGGMEYLCIGDREYLCIDGR